MYKIIIFCLFIFIVKDVSGMQVNPKTIALKLKKIIMTQKVKSVFDAEFGESEWWAANSIITMESRWNPYAINKTSGACGLFQFLPCSKMKCNFDDVKCQARAGVDYIKRRYLLPSRAWDFWTFNSWY